MGQVRLYKRRKPIHVARWQHEEIKVIGHENVDLPIIMLQFCRAVFVESSHGPYCFANEILMGEVTKRYSIINGADHRIIKMVEFIWQNLSRSRKVHASVRNISSGSRKYKRAANRTRMKF